MLLSAETLPEEKRMPIRAKYVHTNLIARDWKRLVRFYRDVFGCEPKGPERDLSAAWLDTVTSPFRTPVFVAFISVCLDTTMMGLRWRSSATIS